MLPAYRDARREWGLAHASTTTTDAHRGRRHAPGDGHGVCRSGPGGAGLQEGRPAAGDAVDRGGRPGQRAAGVPAAAAHPGRVAEPERCVAVRQGRRGTGAAGRAGTGRTRAGPVPHRICSVRNPAPRGPDVVPADLHRPRRLGGSAAAAALRRGRLRRQGLRQRHAGRDPPWRLRRLRRRRHRRAQGQRAAGADRLGRGPHRRHRPADRQAAPDQRPRHLLPGQLRHLADGLDGAGRGLQHQRPEDDPGRRERRPQADREHRPR